VDHRTVGKGIQNRIALVVFSVLAVGTLLLGIFNDKGLLQVGVQSQKLGDLQAEIQKIEQDNKALAEEIQSLRTDPTMIEKLAREELKLVKPGEVVLLAPNDNSPTTK
jgi:cell division protein FtsB